MGLSSIHIKSTKLDSAQPNQGMQCQNVTSEAEWENRAPVAVIVTSFIMLVKETPNGTRQNCEANLELILINHTEKMNNCKQVSSEFQKQISKAVGNKRTTDKHEQHMQMFQWTQVLSFLGNKTQN
jgi:hypothetical protein